MSIDAWAFSTLNSYKLPSFFWTPLLTLSFNLYSGDRDKNDKFLNTYNPLFPNLTHFGEAAILSPQNMMNLMPGITVYPFDYLTIAFDWDLIWRLSRSDSVYVRGARPLKGTDQVNGYFVTDVLSANIDWRINKHTNLGFGFSHYFAHNVIKDTGGTEVNYFKVQLKYSY